MVGETATSGRQPTTTVRLQKIGLRATERMGAGSCVGRQLLIQLYSAFSAVTGLIPLERLVAQSARRSYETIARDAPYRMSVPSAKAPSAYSLRWRIANGIAHLLNR